MGERMHSAPSYHLGQLVPFPGAWKSSSCWKAHLCGPSEGAHIGLLRGIRGASDSFLCWLPRPRASLQTKAVCSENNKGGCRGDWGGPQERQPSGRWKKEAGPGPSPARDRILEQHSLGARGLSCEKLAGQRRREGLRETAGLAEIPAGRRGQTCLQSWGAGAGAL